MLHKDTIFKCIGQMNVELSGVQYNVADVSVADVSVADARAMASPSPEAVASLPSEWAIP